MDDETNPLKTEPVHRSRGPNLARFVREHALDLRARLNAGETAADVKRIVEEMLGVKLRPNAFSSTLSRELKAVERGSPRARSINSQNPDVQPGRPRRLTPNS